ncbi:YjcZ family sporulation protein [Psychrobacillus psychrodurans]
MIVVLFILLFIVGASFIN